MKRKPEYYNKAMRSHLAVKLEAAINDSPTRHTQLQKNMYAGFLRRLLAVLIDGILWAIYTILFSLGVYIGISSLLYHIASGYINSFENIAAESLPLIPIITLWTYFTIMESSKAQATIGKMATRIKVTDLHYSRINFVRANIRFWSKVLSIAILPIGITVALFTNRKQALHDLIAGSLVINKRR